HVTQVRTQRLRDDLLLADDRIHQHRDAELAGIHEEHRGALLDARHRELQITGEVYQRIALATHLDGRRLPGLALVVIEPPNLLYDGHRDGERLLPGAHKH